MTNIYNEGAPTFASGLARSTLTAFFDSRSEAETAIDKLKSAGVSDVRLMPGYEAEGEGPAAAAEGSGFWSRLGDWFFPDEDRHVYAEGLRRGGFLVSVSVDQSSYDTAHDILANEGSIDMDERADLWREEGWTAGGGQQAIGSEDDVVPTGHQRDVSEGDRPMNERASREQSIDDLRQSQMLPGSR